jgi:hypothetical protein
VLAETGMDKVEDGIFLMTVEDVARFDVTVA